MFLSSRNAGMKGHSGDLSGDVSRKLEHLTHTPQCFQKTGARISNKKGCAKRSTAQAYGAGLAEAETIPVTPGRLIVMRAVSRWLLKSYDLRCLSFT